METSLSPRWFVIEEKAGQPFLIDNSHEVAHPFELQRSDKSAHSATQYQNAFAWLFY